LHTIRDFLSRKIWISEILCTPVRLAFQIQPPNLYLKSVNLFLHSVNFSFEAIDHKFGGSEIDSWKSNFGVSTRVTAGIISGETRVRFI
jgi:hypothetical protein